MVSEPEPPVPVEVEEPGPFTPEIQRVNLVHGRFRFLDEKLEGVATFDDVQFRSGFRTANDLRGDISIEKTSLRDRFFLEHLRSPLHYAPDELDFSQITARAGGGEITGRFTLLPQTENSPFTLSVKFRDVQADRIVADAGGTRGMITGRLEGHLDASGTIADENALAGAGEIILRDGQVQQYSLLVALGQLLQIEELRQLRFDQAQVKYHVNPGVITIDELLLRSQNLRLSATGTASFDGKLQLESQLAVSEKMRSQLFRAIRENFQPIDEPGYSAVSFQVSGTVGRPKTNLMDKLIGRDLKDLGSVINSFIGGGKSEKAKKKKAAAASVPAAEPTTTPMEDLRSDCTRRGDGVASAQRIAMRVIAGAAGGIRLDVPKTDVRPTMDRVKAAIFSSLGEEIIGARVLDLFAGTGALGIEALSRGAASALFVEDNSAAIAVIERNLAKTKLRGQVRQQEVFSFLRSAQTREPFNVIFADPPYEKTKSGGEFTSLLLEDEQLAEMLEPSGIFVLEKRPSEEMPPTPLWKIIRGESVRRHRSPVPATCRLPAEVRAP